MCCQLSVSWTFDLCPWVQAYAVNPGRVNVTSQSFEIKIRRQGQVLWKKNTIHTFIAASVWAALLKGNATFFFPASKLFFSILWNGDKTGRRGRRQRAGFSLSFLPCCSNGAEQSATGRRWLHQRWRETLWSLSHLSHKKRQEAYGVNKEKEEQIKINKTVRLWVGTTWLKELHTQHSYVIIPTEMICDWHGARSDQTCFVQLLIFTFINRWKKQNRTKTQCLSVVWRKTNWHLLANN